MKKGTNALLEKLGVLETEQFISTLLREPFDYTEWSREYFAQYEPDQFLAEAVAYDKNNADSSNFGRPAFAAGP